MSRWPWKVAFYLYVDLAASFCIALVIHSVTQQAVTFWQVWAGFAVLIPVTAAVLALAGGALFGALFLCQWLHERAFERGEG